MIYFIDVVEKAADECRCALLYRSDYIPKVLAEGSEKCQKDQGRICQLAICEKKLLIVD